jgi:Skp family chaperone for outer membrane proteins
MSFTATVLKLALGLGSSALVSLPALAQSATSNNQRPVIVSTKIGIVNVEEAIVSNDEGKKEIDALEKRFTPKRDEINRLSTELENLKKDFAAQADKLSDAEKANRAQIIASREKALQRDFDDAQTELQQAKQEIGRRIYKKLAVVMDKFAKEHGYAVLLDVSTQQSPILWASPDAVVTKALVDAYNAENRTAQVNKSSTTPAPRTAAPATKKP